MSNTPKSLGYRFPAEFEAHRATWLSWPHKEASWPGKIESIYPSYSLFVKYLSLSERVCINVCDESMRAFASQHLQNAGADFSMIDFYIHPTNDAWCRDHGPAFLINPNVDNKKIIVDWNYNAWGNKYPPFDLDDVIPTLIGKSLDIPIYYPGIIMEGGSVDFNGKGTLVTSRQCLLNENRNPHLSQHQIENFLSEYYGVDQVLWVSEGIIGDDTDGHIDDTVRFFNEDSVITVVEQNKDQGNHKILNENLLELKEMRLLNGKQLNIVELPMPDAVIWEGQMLPASYANFYITNKFVIVPTFQQKKDDLACKIIQECFKSREVIGIDSTDIIWGLGSFHCLSQQEPLI